MPNSVTGSDRLGWRAAIVATLLLVRVAERRTGMTSRRIAIELSRVHAVTLDGSDDTAVHTTSLSTIQAGILRERPCSSS